MTIKEDIFHAIISSPEENPPETGGALGGRNGIVTHAYFDKGQEGVCPCSYTPNVEKINSVISRWAEEEIDFMGMFHTHFFGVKTMSDGDKRYIYQIMEAISETVDELYFPIVVMPERKLIVYKAICCEEMTAIIPDELKIIS